MTTEIENKIENFLSNLSIEIDLNYHIDIEDLDLTDGSGVYDEILEKLDNDNAFDIEIIYYARAIEYLHNNDVSLQESLEIASEYGFSVENLNSEILASLHASRAVREEFYKLETEITNFFEEIQEQLEELEEEF